MLAMHLMHTLRNAEVYGTKSCHASDTRLPPHLVWAANGLVNRCSNLGLEFIQSPAGFQIRSESILKFLYGSRRRHP